MVSFSAVSLYSSNMSGWDAYIAALLGDKSVMTGAAIYGQGQNNTHTPKAQRQQRGKADTDIEERGQMQPQPRSSRLSSSPVSAPTWQTLERRVGVLGQ